ncbi:hypothetical protein [Chryseobacterium sp. ERMR1:04]|uniref:hypothetical protein n=1 Tax=Chryseobacterium sp. ERMR1:04 TaxID=1705393 RepID=UPI0006C8686A|nr:hypothetical protein [Chryseobacterium sp. ERMR1:04]
MKNQNLINGKKLTNSQLRTITGGLIDCLNGNCPSIDGCPPSESGCVMISKYCGQPQCRPK